MKAAQAHSKRQIVAVLKLISLQPACLVQMNDTYGVSIDGQVRMTCDKAVIKHIVQEAFAIGEDDRLTITQAGRAFLKRQKAHPQALAAQHRDIEKTIIPDHEGTAAHVSVDLNESPLSWLYRRRDKEGATMISDAQFTAGETLRRDFTRAQLQPKITSSWDMSRTQSQGGLPPNIDFSDGTLAAKARVNKAMIAVGPELSGVLLDVCCFLKGLKLVEHERRWPARTGKVILTLALERLAAHYGLLQDKKAAHAKMRSWTAADSRSEFQY